MSRRIPLPIRLSAIALIATGSVLRADNPPAAASPGTPTPPPGYKVVYHGKTPIFVKEQLDPLRHAGGIGDDPLDPQKVFSETNPESNKTFMPGDANVNKSDQDSQRNFTTKVYGDNESSSVYNLGSKPTYKTASYDGAKAAPGSNQEFNTKAVSSEFNHADSAFAPIGASDDQNRTAPIDAQTYKTFANPDSNKSLTGREADAINRRAKPGTPIDGDLQVIGEIPDRPLSVDEVRALINHGFKPNLTEPASPDSKPLNDPEYQPQPLRVEPTSPDDAPTAPSAGTHKVEDDDANDPVPSPGTMAEHPEDGQALPNK